MVYYFIVPMTRREWDRIILGRQSRTQFLKGWSENMKERNKTHPRQNRYRLVRYVKSVPDKAVEIDTQRQTKQNTTTKSRWLCSLTNRRVKFI